MVIPTVHRDHLPQLTAREAYRFEHYLVNEWGYTIAILMEMAGYALAQLIIYRYPDSSKSISFLIGSGHNGGDGLVAARFLTQWGYSVQLYASENARSNSRLNDSRRICENLNMSLFPLSDIYSQSSPGSILIDCLLGIGFTGTLRSEWVDLISFLNGSQTLILSCDVPSGLHVDTGQPQPIAFIPEAILLLSAMKPYLYHWEAPSVTCYFADLSLANCLHSFGIQYNMDMNPNHHLLLEIDSR